MPVQAVVPTVAATQPADVPAASQPADLPEHEVLLARLKKLLTDPGPTADPTVAQWQIDQVIADSGRLARLTPEGPLRLQMYSVQMQGFNNALNERVGEAQFS